MQFLIFEIGAQRYALHLEQVERVLRAVEITVLPKLPEDMLGVINLSGRVIPVLDGRRHFALEAKTLELSDQIIVAQAGGAPIALLVDQVLGVVDYPADQELLLGAILTGFDEIEGVIKLKTGGIAIVDDLEKLHAGRVREAPGGKVSN